jgi:hypothetical protein
MPPILLYLGIALAVISGVYFGIERIKHEGRVEERAAQAVEREKLKDAAREAGEKTTAALAELERAHEIAAAKEAGELGELRDERKTDAGADGVVFDDRWADWLHGGRRARPGS